MTREQFLERFHNGAIVRCHNTEQRRQVLSYVQENGFHILSGSVHGLKHGDTNDIFLHPMREGSSGANVTCVKKPFMTDRETIDFLNISIDGVLSFDEEAPLVAPEDDEFSDMFGVLMGGA